MPLNPRVPYWVLGSINIVAALGVVAWLTLVMCGGLMASALIAYRWA